MSDADFINEQWNKELQELREDYNKWEKHTLSEHIQKCAELLELKIDNGLINIQKNEISSYLYKELKRQEIEVSDRWIQKALPPHFKKEQHHLKPESNSASHDPIWNIISNEDSPVLVESDQSGNIRVNGVLQQDKREPRESLKEIFTVNIEDFKDDVYGTIMNEYQAANTWAAYFKAVGEYYLDMHTSPLIVENLKKTNKIGKDEKEKLIEEFIKREKVSTELQKPIKEHYKDGLEESIKHISDAKTVRNEVDKREKWGYYSKLWQFYIAQIESKANLADLIGYCSKYASIGIERSEDVVKFYNKMLSCPECNKDIHRAMNRIIEEELRREEANLPGLLVPKIQ